ARRAAAPRSASICPATRPWPTSPTPRRRPPPGRRWRMTAGSARCRKRPSCPPERLAAFPRDLARGDADIAQLARPEPHEVGAALDAAAPLAEHAGYGADPVDELLARRARVVRQQIAV